MKSVSPKKFTCVLQVFLKLGPLYELAHPANSLSGRKAAPAPQEAPLQNTTEKLRNIQETNFPTKLEKS